MGSIADREEEEEEIASYCDGSASVAVDLRQRSSKGFKAKDHDRAKNDDI